MKHYDLLIIGGVAAGMSAASQARRIKDNISIAVFEKSDYVSYAACGMPYFIDNIILDQNRLIAIDKNKFIKERNIHIFTKSLVTKVDFENKNVEVKNENQTNIFSYDKLVIATGASAFIPPIKGIDSQNVFALRNLNDGIAIKNYIQSNRPSKGVIIGGGAIGLEMAETLRTLNIETIMLEKLKDIAAAFDMEIRDYIIKELVNNKVTIRTGVDIKEISGNNERLTIHYDSDIAETDFIIVSVGIRPSTDFLKNTGIKMNAQGAIIVNEKSETSIPEVYAAGDCATVKHLIISDDVYMPLGTTSNKQGRVAGLQAVGIHSEQLNGIIGTQFIKIFDLEVAKTGFSESDVGRYGIKAKSAGAQWRSRAGYYPGSKEIYVKITINSDTNEIIGGQIAGYDGAALRANVVAAAIAGKMKIEEFAYLDLGYAPSFSPVWDPLLAAAQNFPRK